MKRSKKVTIGIIIFFIIVATVIGGRTAMGIYFKNKFGKRPPPGVIVEIVSEKKFSKTIESYCTALSSKTTSFKIKKSELLEPIKFKAIKKGGTIAKLQNKRSSTSSSSSPLGLKKSLTYQDSKSSRSSSASVSRFLNQDRGIRGPTICFGHRSSLTCKT